VPAAPLSFDPRRPGDVVSRRIQQLIYDELLTRDDRAGVIAGPPALAIRLDHPDPLTYIVTVRPGVRFHDGRELTAPDVVYTVTTSLDPAVARPRALDDYRIAFTLAEPDDSFPGRLVMPIVPADAGASLEAFPIGTGPYRFVRSIAGEQVELAAYEGYWDGLPLNAGITVRVAPDEGTRRRALRDGSADLILDADGAVTAGARIDGMRLSPPASFGMMKDVRKRQPYGAARSGPSDRPKN
jgi:peptide/nickel transport system substrate-binding protein